MSLSSAVNQILIISNCRFGDSLVMMPALQRLKASFPQASICLLSERDTNGAVSADQILGGRGLVDELNTFDAYLQNSLEFTQDCAIKISIERKEKKSLKDLLGKFFSAKTWTRAVKEEVAQSVNNATPYR